MTSKNTALLDLPVAELIKEAYSKAEELKVSFPDISALLRAAAGRIDVFNALLVLSSSVNVQRYSPDYQMHLNHEMAIMRPTDKGTFVSLADYVALLKERNDLNNHLQKLAAESLPLKKFFDQAWYVAIEGCDFDGASIQGLAVNLGLAKAESYDSEKHSDLVSDASDFEDGCEVFFPVKPHNTDAILNEIRALARAEGIYFAANRILAAWESGFVDDTPAMAHDISGAILSAVEFLPNADEGEFKRDYADEVRARIRAGEVQP